MLSLVAIMLNEAEHVERWARGAALRSPRTEPYFDEVVVVDGGSSDATVQLLRDVGVEPVLRPFPSDFADQRNFAVGLSHNDWIFELDADEIPSAPLLGGLRTVCQNADAADVDVIGIPRLNFHDGKLVASPGYRGLDFQYRLHRRHCVWQGRVHEELVGYRIRIELDLYAGHFILHQKSQVRYDERNELYRRLKA